MKIKLANTINLIGNIEYHLKNDGLKIWGFIYMLKKK